MQETLETSVPSHGWEDPLEERMATHSSILAWGILWTGEPGGSSPRGHRVRDDRSIEPQSTGDALPGLLAVGAAGPHL